MKLIIIAILIFVTAPIIKAQTAPDAAELTKLLNDFLAGASRSDPAIHDRFWADDLIYTRSAGRRVSKSDVMRDVRTAPAPKPGDPTTTYSAEDVRIQQYGDTAIVAFRLVGVTKNGNAIQTAQLLNTGTFLKRNGKWQVVAWQSTRMARSEQESAEQVKQIASSFAQAMEGESEALKNLEPIVDSNFFGTLYDGKEIRRDQFLDGLRSGKFRKASPEEKITYGVFGDTAVATVRVARRRSSTSAGSSDVEVAYTLTLAYQAIGWKVVAMQASGME